MTPKDLFEILVREHAGTLTLYLRSVVRDPALVDDLFQETMLVAWRNLERFDRSRPFGPWLRGIAAKLVLAHRRKSPRAPLLCEHDVLERLDLQFEALGKQTGDTLEEKLEGLRQCLAALPEPYREAVRLRYQEGCKGEGLARRLEVSLENVKKRLQRGRGKLLECLERKLGLVT
ncbi:MAG: sigma-70 family RNA polymerase sigma factor [Planctomycetota bacterium]